MCIYCLFLSTWSNQSAGQETHSLIVISLATCVKAIMKLAKNGERYLWLPTCTIDATKVSGLDALSAKMLKGTAATLHLQLPSYSISSCSQVSFRESVMIPIPKSNELSTVCKININRYHYCQY